MKLGFIGFGNIAQALTNGLIYKNALSADHIYACANNWEKLSRKAKEKGIISCRTPRDLVEQVDIVVVAVKPDLVETVIAPIKGQLVGKIVISVVTGYTYDKYQEILLSNTHHISTIPNTPVSIGEGIMICEHVHSLSPEEYGVFADLFSKIALIEKVDTKNMGIAGTLSGCGPAFTSMYIEALADAAVMHGLPRDISYKMASQMIAGTGKLQILSNAHPGMMKDAVSSPGGSTIVGVTSLEKKGFRGTVIDAIEAIQKYKGKK